MNSKKDLQDLNRKVIEIGEKAGRPVCATSDAHYMFAEDQRNRDILLSNWEKPGKIESHPPVYTGEDKGKRHGDAAVAVALGLLRQPRDQ